LFTSILAIILVYMALASQFRSLKDPLTIMFSVPMGLIGVFWALFLTDTTLSTTSFMGIIMMVGIVVSNGVLLVEYINELRRHGLPLHEAVPRGGRVRLRPILMTVLATVVGLVPMALALGVGTEANQPLAIAVIGGLLASTFFTLVLIPTLYVIFEERWAADARRRREWRRGTGLGPVGVAAGRRLTAGRGRRDERSIRAGSTRAHGRS
jgi:multidrug efflux pump subunit AcrB